MKRLFAFFLMLCLLCISTVVFASDADIKILVNGVSLTLVDNDKVVKPIEVDGIVYVPLAAFLDALNIPYNESNGTYIITYGNIQQATPEPTAAPTPTPKPKTPYEELGLKEKRALDILLKCIPKLDDPGSIMITDMRKSSDNFLGGDGIFYKLSETNKTGGKEQNWYYTYDTLGYLVKDNIFTFDNSVEDNYDIEAMNKALKFKLEEMGYR